MITLPYCVLQRGRARDGRTGWYDDGFLPCPGYHIRGQLLSRYTEAYHYIGATKLGLCFTLMCQSVSRNAENQ